MTPNSKQKKLCSITVSLGDSIEAYIIPGKYPNNINNIHIQDSAYQNAITKPLVVI